MTHHWLAPAWSAMATVPPTLDGLASALLLAERASSLLAHARPGALDADSVEPLPSVSAEGRRVAEVALFCASAAGCLADAERTSGTPDASVREVPPLSAPQDPGDPAHLRALDSLLRDCIDLAVEVLDNEEEDLEVATVHEIAAAVGLLDRARAACLRGAA